MYEIADECRACQRRHLKEVKKAWKVQCKGIPKKLWDEGVYPIEEILPEEEFEKLTEKEKVGLQLRYNKLLWAELKLGWTPNHPKRNQYQYWQQHMIQCTAKFKAARLGRRMGKCTHPDTIIQTNHGPIKAKDLNSKIHEIYTFDENEKQIKSTSSFKTFDNGIKEMYKIETRMGNKDVVTFNHPYFILEDNEFKWVDSKDLKKGDRVLVTKSYENLFKSDITNVDKFRTIGYMISDGGTNYDHQSRFTNFDPTLVKDFNNILKRSFDAKLKRYTKGNYGIKRTKTKNPNKINKLLNDLKLRGLATDKVIPSILFNTNKENVSNFISSAWDCDGWVDDNSIGYCSSSYELANGIKHLLKKFGIQSKLREKKVKYLKDFKTTYQVEVRGLKNLKTFDREIKLLSKGKKLKSLIKGRNKGINNYEMFPLCVNEYVLKQSKDLNINFRAKHNLRIKKTERISYDKLEKVNLILKDKYLEFLLYGDFILDEIKEVEFLSDQMSLGITVNDTHTFITDDIWTHNTEGLVIDAMHFADTTDIPNAHVMIVGPFQNLLEEIFDRMKLMFESANSVFRGKIKSTKQPYSLTLPNGNKILGFTTGTKSGSEGASTRGQRCDKLFLDECDYMSQKDIETIMALMMEHSDFEISCSSTPQAIPGKFREMCLTDPSYKDFYYPSTLLSSFKDQEEAIRRIYNKDGFAREIMAEFYENSSKVFLTEDIRSAFVDYKYAESLAETENSHEYITVLGCDWNSFRNGTQIIVLGFNTRTQKLRVLYKKSIFKNQEGSEFSEHMQTESIRQIIDISKRFDCKKVYVDKGFGGYQAEILEQYYHEIQKPGVFKSIDFGSSIKEHNAYTGEMISKRLKGVLVFSLQQQFEKKRIELSPLEEGKISDTDQAYESCITYQLNNYVIDKFDTKDNPVFAHRGDHVLDALMLANYAFVKEIEQSTQFTPQYSLYGKLNTKSSIVNTKRSSFMNIQEDDTPLATRMTSSFKTSEQENIEEEMGEESVLFAKKRMRNNKGRKKISRKRLF